MIKMRLSMRLNITTTHCFMSAQVKSLDLDKSFQFSERLCVQGASEVCTAIGLTDRTSCWPNSVLQEKAMLQHQSNQGCNNYNDS